jgi:primosomal protein N' (replication factor Y) (superfamily II helicase)
VQSSTAILHPPDTDAKTTSVAAQATSPPQYAEVAVPLRLSQTFTYRLPLALREETQIGARLLVPFGRKLLTAYVVALHQELEAGVELEESEIKEAEALLDAEPLISPDVLELTRWLADYYAAPWGEVLKAALPAGLNSTVEQILTATAEGRDELARLPPRRAATNKARALQLIADESETTLRNLSVHFGQTRAGTLARQLEQQGWIKITHRARSTCGRRRARAERRAATNRERAHHVRWRDAFRRVTRSREHVSLIHPDA